MNTVQKDYVINAPINDVWKAFTTAEVAEQWGAGPARVDANKGGQFSYWGGDVHGITTKIEVEKLLEQDWYEHEHPERLHKVRFTFEPKDNTATTIHLSQTDVGDDELTYMVDGWWDFYFDPMKKLLETQ